MREIEDEASEGKQIHDKYRQELHDGYHESL